MYHNSNIKIRINPYITFNRIDNEIIILSENGSKIFQLNELASEIWNLLESKQDISCIIDILLKKYDADKDIICKDVKELIDNFIKDDLLIKE